MRITSIQTRLITAGLLVLAAAHIPLQAQTAQPRGEASSGASTSGSSGAGGSSKASEPASSKREEHRASQANKHVDDAVAVVHRMEGEPKMKELLQQAKGVFIVPTYGRAAVGVGGSGGSGVLLARQADGSWSDPAFYNIGEFDIGLQAGAEGGPIALVLNNEKALSRFNNTNRFALTADSGITVAEWSRVAKGQTGPGDAVAWSGTKGLFGDVAAIGVSDVRFNHNLTEAYYNKPMTPKQILAEKGQNRQAEPLRQALAGTGAATTGSSGTGSAASGTGSHAGGTGSPAAGTSGESTSGTGSHTSGTSGSSSGATGSPAGETSGGSTGGTGSHTGGTSGSPMGTSGSASGTTDGTSGSGSQTGTTKTPEKP